MKQIFYRIFTALLFLTFVLIPSERVDATPKVFSPHPTALEMIEKVNALRESKGLSPYISNTLLMKIAQDHADYIARTGVMTHFDDKGKRPYQRAIDVGYSVAGNLASGGLLTEAIFSGSGISDDDVLTAWQSNNADAVALLSDDYEDVGVGIAAANGVTYYVLVAGSESDSEISATPTAGTLTAPAGTGIPNTPLPSGEIYHDVQKDEALWSIALLYGTTIAELKLLNGLATDEIFEGQRLIIRRASTETPSPTPVPVTVTLGIPTSTPTKPVTPTITLTPTPLPAPPITMRSGGLVLIGIVLAALLAAGLFSLLGKRKDKSMD
ncbi:MAG: LysM peptidoglycan-binding domain-containing protein [Chloroflexi bacterium]|nr:LysM peptidoglycan-binding domain-containing protein [Chloroflexota bacterium]MBI3168509.1 LysM peptidoglycan-binding domain-containing protein [Chloroflexota bacterium]